MPDTGSGKLIRPDLGAETDPLRQSVQALLADAAKQLATGSESPQLDAEVLLCLCLNKNRSFLRAWPEHRPAKAQIACFNDLILKRRQGVPVAYLTGVREFWSREFRVGADVLIPRPDTERLIELSLDLLPADQPCKIVDLGTGSGILAVTLAAERPLAQVLATDISLTALNLARENAARLKVENVRFLASHWFDSITEKEFDLVISNPPYIASDDPHLLQGDVRFEPKTALVSDEKGLRDIRLIAEQALLHLNAGGHLLLEHGYNQPAEVREIFKRLDYKQVRTYSDLAGNPRVTSGLWNPT
ncbi:peptide chain release factor N(5)-glutamine methyltransferase [Methylomonas sp. MgM2]